MQRFLKAGALILVLVVPALVFIFLKLFGENHFTLRTYYPLTDPTTGAVLVSYAPGASWWEGRTDTVFYKVPTYTIALPPPDTLSGRRKLKSTKDLTGKLVIVSFVGAACDQNCLRVTGQIVRVLDIFGQQPEVTAFTLYDKQSVAQTLKEQYKPVSDRWLMGQPTHKEVARVADYEYRFAVRSITNPRKETFAYNEGLVLIDRDGHIRGYYKGLDKKDVDRLVVEIRVLLDVYAKQ